MAMVEQITRKTQSHAWVVFEKKTGLFQAFFFNKALAEKFVGRHPNTLEMQQWADVLTPKDTEHPSNVTG